MLTSSANAVVAKHGSEAYDVSKAALSHLVRELAIALAPQVRVNGISPATVVKGSTMFPRDRVMASLKKYDICRSSARMTDDELRDAAGRLLCPAHADSSAHRSGRLRGGDPVSRRAAGALHHGPSDSRRRRPARGIPAMTAAGAAPAGRWWPSIWGGELPGFVVALERRVLRGSRWCTGSPTGRSRRASGCAGICRLSGPEWRKGCAAAPAIAGEGIASIAVDGWATDYVRLNEEGLASSDPYCYRDPRTIAAERAVHERIDARHLYALNGLQRLRFNTVYQLYADQMAGIPAAVPGSTFPNTCCTVWADGAWPSTPMLLIPAW